MPIQSAPIEEVTSDGLEELKQLIVKARTERQALREQLPAAQNAVARAERRLARTKNWFLKLFIGSQAPQRGAKLAAQATALKELQERLEGAVIDVDFGLDEGAHASFAALGVAFGQLTAAERIWDITSAAQQDRRVTRSAASRSVDRVGVRFSFAEDDVLQGDVKVLNVRNANGADLLIYPAFVLMGSGENLALIELRDVQLVYESARFVETERVPSDARVVDRTWAKVNKNGSPDKRFKDNYEIPVVAYGKLVWRSPGGLHEEYMVSSDEKAQEFAAAFAEHQTRLHAQTAWKPEPAKPPPRNERPRTEVDPQAVAWESLPYLRRSVAVSPQHALDVLKHFFGLFQADVNSLNGTRKMAELEAFVNTAASVPEVVREFLRRAPGLETQTEMLARHTDDMVADLFAQTRRNIEGADPAVAAGEDAQRVLRLLADAERHLASKGAA